MQSSAPRDFLQGGRRVSPARAVFVVFNSSITWYLFRLREECLIRGVLLCSSA